MERTTQAVSRPAPRARAGRGKLLAGGPSGNELLTSATGAVLIVLLAIIGVTIPRIRTLLWVHMFVGLLLLGPLAVKLGSTGYRFTRYYTHAAPYVRKGPPAPLLRATAPIVVLTSLLVMGSGIALLAEGPGSRAALLPLHKISFIVWVAFTGLHVLLHLPDLARGLREDYGPLTLRQQRTPGRSGRGLALASALVLGVVIAVLCAPAFGAWVNAPLRPH